MERSKSTLGRIGTAAQSIFVWVFFIVWTTGWTIGTIGLDASYVSRLWQQTRSAAFPSTDGTIVHNQLPWKMNKRGASYRVVEMRYAYEVNGRRYESDRTRFGLKGNSQSEAWAAGHPVGTPLRVFYNPRDPSEAALEKGVSAADLAFPLILLVFNVVAYVSFGALLACAWDGAKSLVGFKPAVNLRRRGALLVPEGRGLFQRLGLFTLLFTALVAWLVYAGLFAGRGVGAMIMALFWLVVLYCMLKFLRTRWRWGWSQAQSEFEIDPVRRLVMLPSEPGRPGLRRQVRFDEVLAVEVVEHEPPANPKAPPRAKDDGRELFVVTLRWEQGGQSRTAMAGFYADRAAAERLRDWIAVQVGVDVTAGAEVG